MRKITLLLAVVVGSLPAFCQKNNFIPGYYITHTGDTINGFGYISNKNKISTFDFKTAPDATDHLTIAALNCREITFGKNTYVTWYGKRSLEYVNGNDLYTVRHQGEYATDSICIALIYQGRGFALYQYQGSEKMHFFIKTHNSIDELILAYDNFPEYHRLAASNYQKAAYIVKKTYQSQIYSLLNDRINTRKKIDLLWATEFDRHSLLKLFKKIDQE